MFFVALAVSCQAAAQSWDFVKEKDGIKIYTCKDAGNSLKSYKGVTDIHAPAEKVFSMIEDINHTEWWDKSVSRIKVLHYEKYKLAQYYMIYDLPWPVTDRDLYVNVVSTFDPVTGEGKVKATPLNGSFPSSHNMVRMKDYRQTWTIKSAGQKLCHVILEGFVDPGGSIPDWICNMVIVDSPIKAITELKLGLEKK
jgi:hypothetical protein